MLPLPGPERSDRATRDRTPRPKHRVALSVLPQWFLTLGRLPPNPQVGVPGSPGPRGPRMATENDWPAPAGQFQLGSPRHGLRSPGGAPREKRMEEVQWLLRGRSLTPKTGAHAWALIMSYKNVVAKTLRWQRYRGYTLAHDSPAQLFESAKICPISFWEE